MSKAELLAGDTQAPIRDFKQAIATFAITQQHPERSSVTFLDSLQHHTESLEKVCSLVAVECYKKTSGTTSIL